MSSVFNSFIHNRFVIAEVSIAFSPAIRLLMRDFQLKGQGAVRYVKSKGRDFATPMRGKPSLSLDVVIYIDNIEISDILWTAYIRGYRVTITFYIRNERDELEELIGVDGLIENLATLGQAGEFILFDTTIGVDDLSLLNDAAGNFVSKIIKPITFKE